MGNPIVTWVPGYSTRQIVEVIEDAGILVDVNIFSVAIDTNGADLSMYASVVDNYTGDPVLYSPADAGNLTAWIPGIARLAGANNSLWRSDITFLNDTNDYMSWQVKYVPENNVGGTPIINENNVEPGHTRYYVDILDFLLPPDTDSKGYLVVTGQDGSTAPHIVAKTYNLAPEGGTFGQNLKVYGESDLIHSGETGYITGVANSPVSDEGFRTNMGVLNTNAAEGATIAIKVLDTEGGVLAYLSEWWLAPGQFLQANLFEALGIGDLDGWASVEISVTSGGPVAAYASEIDNRTQDPILIPAIPMEILVN
jgi:hypothetical protein